MIARYKDLCLDAVDVGRLGAFWAAALGLDLEVRADGIGRLTGPTPQHTVWVNPVPEPVTAKQRLHLDVHAAAVDDVLALGATLADDSRRWTVVRDPEGGELCVFVRDEAPAYRLYELVLDCAEPRELAAWWGEVLGGVVGYDEEQGWAWVEEIPGAPFECLVFVAVPEPKTVKNRIHLDVLVADVGLLVAAGARVLEVRGDWTVLADPEGNELCAFVEAAR